MRASFQVLDQPWIPVIAGDGTERLQGLRETLTRAHELREISSASPLEEYAVYRFLGLFLMDALRPESEEDIEDLLDRGSFDPERLETYIAMCQSEGVSFDLFDEKRPFLQSAYDKAYDREEKPVSTLNCMLPSGNNHTHFDHAGEIPTVLPPDAALRQILASYLFCIAAAQGYPSGVNASPPYFGVIHGANLFETLIFTLLPTDTIDLPLDKPPVLWRRTDPVIPKREIGSTSWLHGMLFPTRRICLIPDENGTVKGVYLCQGENFVNKPSWHDPYVTYRLGKDGLFPMRPNADRALWRNLSDIVDVRGKQASQLLAQYRSIRSGGSVEITLYGVETSNASYLGLYRHSLSFPLSLADDQRLADLLRQCIASAEKLAAALRRTLNGTKVLPESAVSLAIQQYYQKCEAHFWTLCEHVGQNGFDLNASIAFCDEISDIAGKTYTDALSGLNLRAASLAAAEKQRGALYKSINKLKKEVRL